jgi:hypothetical protein
MPYLEIQCLNKIVEKQSVGTGLHGFKGLTGLK